MRKMEISNKLALICLFLFTFCGLAHANKIIYVDDDAAGANDGSSWQNAYIYLQDALADANSSEKPALSLSNGPLEIHVAQGTYKPDQGNGQTAGDREAAFQLISGVKLSGGYAGIFEPDPNERDYQKYETILTGDLAGNDIETNDPNDLKNEPTREDNSFTVINAFWTDSASLLDGFSIAGGTDPNYDGGSGGIRMDSGKLQICNCSFINNFVAGQGGGISVNDGQVSLTNCVFKANAAFNGGGIYNVSSEIKLVNCFFENNLADFLGGGIRSKDSKIIIEKSIFNNNSVFYFGGAVCLEDYLEESSFNNSLFVDNSSMNYGGALSMASNNSPLEITNCTFAGNSASHGKSIDSDSCDLKIKNSILYNGGQDEIWNYYSKIEVCYSNIQNGRSAIYGGQKVWGEGNIDTDPLFADPNNVDYHLKSQAGRFDSNTQIWVQDDVTSSCIDAGDPNSPIGTEPFPNGGYINMGAYGGTVEASKSYFGKPICETIVAGDINGDCKVNELDYEIMMIHWLEEH